MDIFHIRDFCFFEGQFCQNDNRSKAANSIAFEKLQSFMKKKKGEKQISNLTNKQGLNENKRPIH